MTNPRVESLRRRLKQALPDYPDLGRAITAAVLERDLSEIIGALNAQIQALTDENAHIKAPDYPLREVFTLSKQKKALAHLRFHVEDLGHFLDFMKSQGIEHDQLNTMILQAVNTGNYQPLREVVAGRAQGIKGRADHALIGRADSDLPLSEYFKRSRDASQLMKAWFDSAEMAKGAYMGGGRQLS